MKALLLTVVATATKVPRTMCEASEAGLLQVAKGIVYTAKAPAYGAQQCKKFENFCDCKAAAILAAKAAAKAAEPLKAQPVAEETVIPAGAVPAV